MRRSSDNAKGKQVVSGDEGGGVQQVSEQQRVLSECHCGRGWGGRRAGGASRWEWSRLCSGRHARQRRRVEAEAQRLRGHAGVARAEDAELRLARLAGARAAGGRVAAAGGHQAERVAEQVKPRVVHVAKRLQCETVQQRGRVRANHWARAAQRSRLRLWLRLVARVRLADGDGLAARGSRRRGRLPEPLGVDERVVERDAEEEVVEEAAHDVVLANDQIVRGGEQRRLARELREEFAQEEVLLCALEGEMPRRLTWVQYVAVAHKPLVEPNARHLRQLSQLGAAVGQLVLHACIHTKRLGEHVLHDAVYIGFFEETQLELSFALQVARQYEFDAVGRSVARNASYFKEARLRPDPTGGSVAEVANDAIVH